MKFVKFVAGGCLVFGVSHSALAEEANDTVDWQHHDYVMEFSGSAVKKKAREKQFLAETIYTNKSDARGNVAITCINEVYTVSVSYKPIDMEDFVVNNRTTKRWRTRKVEMKVNGEVQKMNDWTYLPKIGVFLPRKKSDRAKIYNAAIKGDAISLNMDFKEAFPLILPKPNKAFKEFGGACGMGLNKDKPHKTYIENAE